MSCLVTSIITVSKKFYGFIVKCHSVFHVKECPECCIFAERFCGIDLKRMKQMFMFQYDFLYICMSNTDIKYFLWKSHVIILDSVIQFSSMLGF